MSVLKSILLLTIILAMAACGLPDQYYIQAPVAGTIAQGSVSQFNFSNPDHNKDLNINFKGYELYYQFYANFTDININAYDPNNTSDVNAQLLAAGFQLVAFGGGSFGNPPADQYPNRTDPVIPIGVGDIGSAFSVVVQIITSLIPAAQYTTSIGGFGNLRRNVQDQFSSNTGQFKGFQSNATSPPGPNYVVSDGDCSRIISNITNSADPVYLAMYAVSYGLIGVSTPQRSVPTYLGYLTVSITH